MTILGAVRAGESDPAAKGSARIVPSSSLPASVEEDAK